MKFFPVLSTTRETRSSRVLKTIHVEFGETNTLIKCDTFVNDWVI